MLDPKHLAMMGDPFKMEITTQSRSEALRRSILHRFGSRMPEWQGALATLLLGIVFLSSDGVFRLQAYDVLKVWAGQQTWGWILMGLGGFRIIILCINGSLPRGSPHIRALLSGVTSVIWLVMLAGYISAPVASGMIAFVATAFVFEFVNIKRAASSAKIEDFKKGGKNGNGG